MSVSECQIFPAKDVLHWDIKLSHSTSVSVSKPDIAGDPKSVTPEKWLFHTSKVCHQSFGSTKLAFSPVKLRLGQLKMHCNIVTAGYPTAQVVASSNFLLIAPPPVQQRLNSPSPLSPPSS